MISRLALLATAGLLALAAGTRAADAHPAITGSGSDGRIVAGELCAGDARVVALGTGSAVVYYTYDPEGRNVIRVVTTVGIDPQGAAASARLVSYLTPGQKAEVSVAGAAGTAPAALELAYENGRLLVQPAQEGPQS